MRQELIDRLKQITPEERALLDGADGIERERYTSRREFVIDSRKLLERGKLIDMRPHTRFVHFPRHRHDYVELVYMCAGTTTHILNDTDKIVMQEGDLLFLNQTVYQEILPASEDDLAVNFIILPEFFDRTLSVLERENVLRDFLISVLSGDTNLTSYLYIQARDILPVQNLMENMIWTLLNHTGGTNTLNQSTMSLLFLNLSLFAESISSGTAKDSDQNLVFYVLRYVDTHYRDGTLEEVSRLVNRPAYTVSRVLKKHTGSCFKALLQQRKLQQAAYLLTNTPLPVDVILERIGYDNSSYFYRRFREKYGVSPAAFREAAADAVKPVPRAAPEAKSGIAASTGG